ncbi:MAG: O-antigen ligase family protein [Patescibacteria group bacterium]|jgi:O-antigen ligase
MDLTIIIYLLLLILLNRLNLKIAVLFLIFALPTYLIRFSIGPLPTTLLEVSILITFLNWIIDNYKQLFFKRQEKNKRVYPFGWEIISVLLISFIAVFIGGIDNPTLGIFKAYFLEPLMVFILIINTLKGKEGIKQIITALALSTLIVSLFAIWQKITGQFIYNDFWANPENRRVVSFFSYPNAVALYLAPIIPLIIGTFIYQAREKLDIRNLLSQLLLFFTAIAGIITIYFSKSKGALIALGLAILLSIFISLKNKIKIIITPLLILLVLGFGYYQKDWINLKMSSSLSWQIRQLQWQETKKMLNDGNFFWGAGLNNYQTKIKPYHQEGFFFNKDADPDFQRKVVWSDDDNYRKERWQPLEIYLYPHNIFLNFWTELGFLGMLIFIFIITKFLFLSLKSYWQEKHTKDKYLSLGLFSSMLIILIHGLVDVPYFKNDLSILFWIIVSLLIILRMSNNSKKLWKK